MDQPFATPFSPLKPADMLTAWKPNASQSLLIQYSEVTPYFVFHENGTEEEQGLVIVKKQPHVVVMLTKKWPAQMSRSFGPYNVVPVEAFCRFDTGPDGQQFVWDQRILAHKCQTSPFTLFQTVKTDAKSLKETDQALRLSLGLFEKLVLACHPDDDASMYTCARLRFLQKNPSSLQATAPFVSGPGRDAMISNPVLELFTQYIHKLQEQKDAFPADFNTMREIAANHIERLDDALQGLSINPTRPNILRFMTDLLENDPGNCGYPNVTATAFSFMRWVAMTPLAKRVHSYCQGQEETAIATVKANHPASKLQGLSNPFANSTYLRLTLPEDVLQQLEEQHPNMLDRVDLSDSRALCPSHAAMLHSVYEISAAVPQQSELDAAAWLACKDQFVKCIADLMAATYARPMPHVVHLEFTIITAPFDFIADARVRDSVMERIQVFFQVWRDIILRALPHYGMIMRSLGQPEIRMALKLVQPMLDIDPKIKEFRDNNPDDAKLLCKAVVSDALFFFNGVLTNTALAAWRSGTKLPGIIDQFLDSLALPLLKSLKDDMEFPRLVRILQRNRAGTANGVPGVDLAAAANPVMVVAALPGPAMAGIPVVSAMPIPVKVCTDGSGSSPRAGDKRKENDLGPQVVKRHHPVAAASILAEDAVAAAAAGAAASAGAAAAAAKAAAAPEAAAAAAAPAAGAAAAAASWAASKDPPMYVQVLQDHDWTEQTKGMKPFVAVSLHKYADSAVKFTRDGFKEAMNTDWVQKQFEETPNGYSIYRAFAKNTWNRWENLGFIAPTYEDNTTMPLEFALKTPGFLGEKEHTEQVIVKFRPGYAHWRIPAMPATTIDMKMCKDFFIAEIRAYVAAAQAAAPPAGGA